MNDVERTLVISIVLVIVVVFLFLRSARATLIPSVAVPVSLIGTFAVMYLLRLQHRQPLSDGPDDFHRLRGGRCDRGDGGHLAPPRRGASPFAAALQGAREIGFTVFSISISLIAVFIPILMMAGIVGRLFREFAIVLSTAILVSMIVSLTTTPMMCAHLLKDERNRDGTAGSTGPARASSTGCFRSTGAPWPGCCDTHGLMLVVLLLTIALNVAADRPHSQGLLPAAGHRRDRGRRARAAGRIVLPDGLLDPATGRRHQGRPGCRQRDRVHRRSGATNGGFIYIALKPLEDRKVTAPEIIGRLRPKMSRLPVASAFLQAAQDLRVGGRQSNALYQYTIQSDNVRDLSQWGPILLRG